MTVEDEFPRFHPILGSRNHEEVVDQITFAIRAGKYSEGDYLPKIEELSRAMGVSKPTVGEALNVLAAHGVVRKKRGSTGGVIVLSNVVPESVLGLTQRYRNLKPRELVEVRRPIEIQLSLLAAQRGTESDFDRLDECVRALEIERDKPQSEPERWAYYDHLFHYLVARMAVSEALAQYQHEILEQLSKQLAEYFLSMENPDEVIKLHRENALAIRSRDKAQIVKMVDRHLLPLERFVFAAFPHDDVGNEAPT
jgi:GntR family transcriptional repressor for pyruvate dehydrogenase complex